MDIIKLLELGLGKVDNWRNRVFYKFLTPHWPMAITPNHITWSRVFIGLTLFVLIFFLNIHNKTLILSLFTIGVITDFMDGPVARGTNRVTEFGAMLDSTADRILIIPIAVYSLFEQHKWLLLFLLVAEILNALFSIFYKSKEIYLESNIFGKTKMVMVSIVFAAILFFWPKAPSELFIDVLWLSILFSFFSIFSKSVELNQKGHIKNKIIKKELTKYENIQHPHK